MASSSMLRDFAVGGNTACGNGATGASATIGKLANQVVSANPWDAQRMGNPLPMGHEGMHNGIDRLAHAEVLQDRALAQGWQSATSTSRQVDAMVEEFGRSAGLHRMPQGMNPRHPAGIETMGKAFRAFVHRDFEAAFQLANDTSTAMLISSAGPLEKARIRDRSTILARQIFAADGPAGQTYADRQVDALMHALKVEAMPGRFAGGRMDDFEHIWSKSANQDFMQNTQTQNWVNDFNQNNQAMMRGPQTWDREFLAQQNAMPPNQWVNDFQNTRDTQQNENVSQTNTVPDTENELLNHTRALEATMAASEEPKFRQSKFLDFVSKMNTGELKIVDDSLVEDSTLPSTSQGQTWASEFNNRTDLVRNEWAQEFEDHSKASWAEEFTQQNLGNAGEQWANEFVHRNPADISSDVLRNHAYDYNQANPFESHEDPFALGKELYEKGILSEAALALEAAVKKDINTKEAWLLLGQVHAENDDDNQAIAAMVQAHKADPSNLDVLLDLGVSHTNELEQHEALNYLREWLGQHHVYKGRIALPSHNMSLEETIVMFDRIAQTNPEDAQVFTALGVLYNLSKDYQKAEGAFKRALDIQPESHSLWNKLGATQANSSNSTEAVVAYQRALDLKANYVRAWSNMGIGFSNQGKYRESIPYYVRALSMNANAEQLWGYLKIAMACSGKMELTQLVNDRNIQALQREFPI